MDSDYSKLSMDELDALSNQVFAKYSMLATRPCGDWAPDKSFTELEAVTEKLNAINDEIERRLGLT